MNGFSTYLITHPNSKYDFSSITNYFEKIFDKNHNSSFTIVSQNRYGLDEIKNIDFFISEFRLIFLNLNWFLYINKKNKRIVNLIKLSMYIFLDFTNLMRKITKYLLSKKSRLKFKTSKLRVLNINFSHLYAWHEGLKFGSDYVCILEDDGFISSDSELNKVLNHIISLTVDNNISFFDISNSFSIEQLGANNLRFTVFNIQDLESQKFTLSEIPITNTCCAIIYSKSLLEQIHNFVKTELNSHGKRTIPIDWLINKFLLSNNSSLNVRSFHVWPGIIIQRSLHS